MPSSATGWRKQHPIADDETVLRAIRQRAFARPQEAVAQALPAFFTDPEVLAALLAGIDTPLGRGAGSARS